MLEVQLPLGLFALCDVSGDAGVADDVAGCIPDLETAVMDPPDLTIRAGNSILDIHAGRFCEVCAEHGNHPLPVLRDDSLQPLLGFGVEALNRATPNPFVGGADVTGESRRIADRIALKLVTWIVTWPKIAILAAFSGSSPRRRAVLGAFWQVLWLR